MAPSQPLPLLEAWVAAGRTGWELPLPLGAEVGTWRAPPVADAAAAHSWPRASCSCASSPPCPHRPAMDGPAEPRIPALWDTHENNISEIR